jgi:hypothetical protein
MEATTALVTIDYDTTLEELMAEPLTHALMKADRVDVGAFERMLRSLAARLQGTPRLAPQLAVDAKPATSAGFERSIDDRRSRTPAGRDGAAASWMPQRPHAAIAAQMACASPCAR